MLELPMVQNMPEYDWILPNYAWICRNMCEYAHICLNGFCFTFTIVIHCLLERVLTYFNIYTKLEVIVWENMRWDKVWFSISSWKLWFNFWLKRNIFTRKLSNLLFTLGQGAANLNISTVKSLTTTKH